MIAYLTIEKINDKWKGRGISEKISLTKSYTTIGGMDHHDIKVPFSIAAAYLSIHEDEEGNYYLSAYDIPVFINDRKITESICLRDKDHIRIGEDYTFGFNQIKPVNVTPKKTEPAKEPPKLAALKPSKSALMKKTAVLEQMKNTALQAESGEKKAPLAPAETLQVKPELGKPAEAVLETTGKETPQDEVRKASAIPASGGSAPQQSEDPTATKPPEIKKEEAREPEPPTEEAREPEPPTEEAREPEPPTEEAKEPEPPTEEAKEPEKKEEPAPLASEPEKKTERHTKKVDLSLRDKRGHHTFRKQKMVVRMPEHAEEGKAAVSPAQPSPMPREQAQMAQWQQAIQNLIGEPNNALLAESDNALEDSKKVITTWKQTLQNLIEPPAEGILKDASQATNVGALAHQERPTSSEDPQGQALLDSWKKALHAIMEQAKEAEEANVSPEDSRDLITNWKETLEGLMEEAVALPCAPLEPPLSPPQESFTGAIPEANLAREDEPEEMREEEDASKELREVQDANLALESQEEPERAEDNLEQEAMPEPSSSLSSPNAGTDDKKSEILTSWKETLQSLVERNYKEKNLESESKILAEKISRAKASLSESKILAEKISRAKASLSESKILGQRPEKPGSESKILGHRPEKMPESESQKSPLRPPLSTNLQTERRTLDSLRSEAFSNTRQVASLTKSMPEPEMTLMWEAGNVSDNTVQRHPKLISPSSGEILSLEKDLIIIGRSASCDMCLVDDYISRQHLELKKIPLGFLVKNIGKNEVFLEKRSQQTPSFEGKIALEQKVLKPGESSLLLQEATIMIGKELLYYFSIPESQDMNAENQIRERKFGFYKNLAKQKKELLDAAQLQKSLIPPKVVFEDLGIGVWFKYMAINDLSGDFFLYHREADALYFCLGDVSGHGAAAALMASQISGMFRILAEHQASVEGIMDSINQNLFRAKRRTHNLYALVNVLKVTADGIELCIAGNSVPPLYYSDARQELIALSTPSTPTGLFTSTHFRTYLDVLKFEKNDMLIMFTDGVTEAEMIDGALLEYHRAEEYIKNQIRQRQSWEFFLDNFLTWVKQHCEIRDDLSIVLIGKLDQ